MFYELASMVRFKPLNMSRSSTTFMLHPELSRSGISIAHVVSLLVEVLDDIPYQRSLVLDSDIERAAQRLRDIVPKSQGPAPLQFQVVDNKIKILHVPSDAAAEDRSNVAAARDQLLVQSGNILDELSRSNCDKRLIETVKNLHERLSCSNDVIRLGMSNIACEMMRKSFSDELPDALSSMIAGQTVGISMYVGQFSEWRRFTELAALSQISIEDAPILSAAISDVITRLDENPSLADPEVPASLRAVRAFIDDPQKAGKRAIYAVWRTMENLLIGVFNFGASLILKTAEKTAEKVSTAAARAIVVALLSSVIVGAGGMVVLAQKIPESAWIVQAVNMIKTKPIGP